MTYFFLALLSNVMRNFFYLKFIFGERNYFSALHTGLSEPQFN